MHLLYTYVCNNILLSCAFGKPTLMLNSSKLNVVLESLGRHVRLLCLPIMLFIWLHMHVYKIINIFISLRLIVMPLWAKSLFSWRQRISLLSLGNLVRVLYINFKCLIWGKAKKENFFTWLVLSNIYLHCLSLTFLQVQDQCWRMLWLVQT